MNDYYTDDDKIEVQTYFHSNETSWYNGPTKYLRDFDEQVDDDLEGGM